MQAGSVFFDAYPDVASLAALPWADAKLLASEVAWECFCDPNEGLWFLLTLLCRVPLVQYARWYPRITANDLVSLLYEGAMAGVSPWNHVGDALKQAISDAKQEREALSLLVDEPVCEGIDPLESLYSQEILSQLTPEDRETLLLAASHSTQALAVQWGVSFDSANTRIRRTRERLNKLSSR